MTQHAPTSDSRRATAREFFSVVFRRKWIIFGLFLVTTTTVLAMALSTPISYMSVARVLIKRGEKESLLQPYRRVFDWKEDLASEIELIRSQAVVQRAQALLKQRVQEGGPEFQLSTGHIDVEVVGQSNAMLIAYLDGDPLVAQLACEAILTAYLEYRNHDLNLAYPKVYFDDEIAKVTAELSRWEHMRRNFVDQSGVTDLNQQRNSAISYRMGLEQRRDEFTTQLAEAQSNLEASEAFARDPSQDLPMLGALFGDETVLVELKMKVINQEARLAQLRERYRDDSPDVVTAMSTLEQLRQMMTRQIESRVRLARSRVESIRAKLAPIEHELARTGEELAAIPSMEMNLNRMDREISVLKSRYAELVRSSDVARLNEQTTSSVNVMVLAPPGAAVPSNSRDYVRLALAPAFSLVVGLGLAFFVDGLDSRLRTPGDLENALNLPVLTSVTERRSA